MGGEGNEGADFAGAREASDEEREFHAQMSNGNRGEGRDQGQSHGARASDRQSRSESRSESPSANRSASLETKARRRRSICRLLRRPNHSWCGRPRRPTQPRAPRRDE